MNTQRLLLVSTVATLTGAANTAACAQPLAFRDAPIAAAAAQVGTRYGVGIDLAGLGGVRVTFTVDDPDAAGARLQVISALANAAGAGFTKTYVIGKAEEGADASPAARVDATASLPSSQQAYPAQEAIAMVAGLDDADVHFISPVGGTVTLTGATLTVAQAAAQIAQQTRTRWGTTYTLQPRGTGRLSGGTIIGRTDGGSPILQFASVYYHDAAWRSHQAGVEEAERQEALAEQQEVQAEQAAEQAALAQQGAGVARTGYGVPSPSQGGSLPYGNGYGAGGQGNGVIVIGGQSSGNGQSYRNGQSYGAGGGY